MGKVHVRILFGHLGGGLHVAPACGENDLASIVNAFFDRFLRSGSITVVYDLAFNLVGIQAEILLHSLDTKVVCVGIAASLRRIGDVEYAYFYIILGYIRLSGSGRRSGLFRGSVSLICCIVIGSLSGAACAAGQDRSHQKECGTVTKCFLLHSAYLLPCSKNILAKWCKKSTK